MRREVMHPAQHLEVLRVVLASGPVADDRVDGTAVMHVEDGVPVERAALFARVARTGERDEPGGTPDVMVGPGAPTSGGADTVAASRRASALVAGASGDRAGAGPSVHDGVHIPNVIPNRPEYLPWSLEQSA